MTSVAISTATDSHETSRLDPSPRKTPMISSAIAAQTSTTSGTAGASPG